MRKHVSIFFFGACVIAGPANAQPNPLAPSGATAPIGSLANGAPAWASRRSIRGGDIGPRHASVGQRHQGDTK
jgi:hypothetical protein